MSYLTIRHNLRIHGEAPYCTAVVHGGPGGAGEMASVARRLSHSRGVLEPLQTETSVDDQVEELHAILRDHADRPTTVIGFSWGAWLSMILAVRHPDSTARIILVGAGPFRQEYVTQLHEARQLRGDEYDPVNDPLETELMDVRKDIYDQVWPQAAELRESGALLELTSHIRCPVLAIHGDCDPHPWQGVSEPLSEVVPDFRFELLKKCGHKPWTERQARDHFYQLLETELSCPADRVP